MGAGNKTITLKGSGISEEKYAAAAVSPGDLVELTSADKFQRHSESGGNAVRRFAIEDKLQGNEITEAYAIGETVFARAFSNGERVNAILAINQTIVIGDKLESNGGRKLRKYSRKSSSTVDVAESVVAVA